MKRAPLALLVALVLAASARATNPSLTLVYQGGGAFTLTLGDGTPVRSGSVIAPGVYDVIFDLEGPDPFLQFSGPGVSITYSEYASTSFTRVLIADSTYTLTDVDPGGTVVTFRTGDPPAGATSTTATTPLSGPPESNGSVVGSARVTSAGTLDADLAGQGAPALTLRGKPVTRVHRGRYTFALIDRTSSAGLELGKAGGTLRALSSRTFVGSRRVTVVLTPGRWTLSAGPGEHRSFLVV